MSDENLSLAMRTVNTLYSVGAAVKEGKVLIESDSVWRELTAEEMENVAIGVNNLRHQIQAAKAQEECSKRINAHWNQIGQINASLRVYGEEDAAACSAWISSNRKALVALLAREDLLEINVSDDQYWPD